MHPIAINSHYYQQFDMDGSLEVPAEGAGGWKEASLTYDRDRMAVVVMHAVDCLTPEEMPWSYRCVKYLRRASVIGETVLGPLLSAVREAGLRVYHVVPRLVKDHEELPGFQRAVSLGGPRQRYARIEIDDPLMKALRQFHFDHVMPGAHNVAGPQWGNRRLGFMRQAAPMGEEGVVETSQQLLALCQADGVNHLVYCGFAANECVVSARGGMVDMVRSGLMCSALRQAVTAIENKETARSEAHKEYALWHLSLDGGFVFDVEEFTRAIR